MAISSRYRDDAPVFQLTSPAFEDAGSLPNEYAEVSPPLEWTDPPEGTRSLALLVEKRPKLHATWEQVLESEPDAYWVVWGLPPRAGRLDAGAEPIRTGIGAHGPGYSLVPPPEYKSRVLVFRLLALSAELELPRDATRSELILAAADLIVDEADLEVTWNPRGRPWLDRVRRFLP